MLSAIAVGVFVPSPACGWIENMDLLHKRMQIADLFFKEQQSSYWNVL